MDPPVNIRIDEVCTNARGGVTGSPVSVHGACKGSTEGLGLLAEREEGESPEDPGRLL